MFKLKQLNDLKRDNDTVKSYYDVHLPEITVNEDNFTNQPLRFAFSNSQNQWWVPSKSYLRVSFEITDGGGKPVIGFPIAPSFNLTSCLFRDCSLSVDNLTVERVSNKLQEIDSLKKRMKNRGHVNSVEDSMNFMMPTFTERHNSITDGKFLVSDHLSRVADTDVKEEDKLGSVNVFDTIYRPPLSLFNDCEHALPSGQEWALTLNPNLDYQTACIQRIINATDVDDVEVKIKNIRLYVYKVERETATPMQSEFFLDCLKVQCHERNLDGTGVYQDDFTVAPNTKWLAVAFQHVNSGSDPTYPSTQFIDSLDDALAPLYKRELALRNIRFTYAMQNKPNPDEHLEWGLDTSNLQYAYFNNLIQTDRHNNNPETYEEWLRNGPYHLYKFEKDSLDESQNVNLRLEFLTNNDIEDFTMQGMRLLLFSIHPETTFLKMVDGRYVKVESRTV